MSLSPAPSTTEPTLFARTYAIRLGLVLLIAFAFIIALHGYDESRREKLETFEEVTAVGDRNLYPIPEEAGNQPPALTFNGKPLVPVSYDRVKQNDAEMLRAGVAQDTAIRLYVPRERSDDEDDEKQEKPEPGTYYLKVERDRYIKVRAQ